MTEAKELDQSLEKARNERHKLHAANNKAELILGRGRYVRQRDGSLAYVCNSNLQTTTGEQQLKTALQTEVDKALKSGPVKALDPKTYEHPDNGKIAMQQTYNKILLRKGAKFKGDPLLRRLVRAYWKWPQRMSPAVIELVEKRIKINQEMIENWQKSQPAPDTKS